jgi:pyruvate dehydrogenase E1 component alpha subunit
VNAEIAVRARAFGLPAYRLATDDVFEIVNAARQAVSALRGGEGPRFLEVPTYRWREHVGPGVDFAAGYRSLDDAQSWFDNDQVHHVAGLLPPHIRAAVERQVELEIADAVEFAERSPFPESEELFTDVFAA